MILLMRIYGIFPVAIQLSMVRTETWYRRAIWILHSHASGIVSSGPVGFIGPVFTSGPERERKFIVCSISKMLQLTKKITGAEF
jgi:hypothetical protein